MTKLTPAKLTPTNEPFPGLHEHYRGLLRFAYLVTGKVDVAEDLTQEVLARAADRRIDFKDPRAGSYLRTIALNAWNRSRRRRAMELAAWIRSPLRSRDLSAATPPDETRVLVWQELRRLPGSTRQCLVLRYYEDWSLEEIARALDLPVGTVKSHISRGLRRMAARLKEEP